MMNINKMFNIVYKYKYLYTILMAILLAFTYGINFWEYIIYNFDKLYLFENNLNYLLDPRIQMVNSGAVFLNMFNNVFKSILQIPILYLISSILIKSSVIYVIYLIINKLINNKNLSFIIALFFIIAPTISYYVPNGFFGGPIFFRASISGLLTLAGIYLLISKRYYLSIIPLVLSLNFHVLFGASAFVFILFSFMYYAIAISSRDILKKLLIISIVIGANILLIISNIDSSTFNTLSSGMENWYKYVFANDPDDMSMLYVIGTNGYFLVPFIAFSIYFYFKNKNKQMIDYLFMGSTILLCIIIIIEVLHYNSIFFGSLSEKFIGIQFRRGIWIIWLFSTIINFVNIQKIINSGEIKKIFLMISISLLYLYPNLYIFILLSLINIFYFKNINIIYILLISLIVVYIGNYLDFFVLIKPYSTFGFNIIVTFIIIGLYYKKIITKDNILLVSVMLFLLISSAVGISRGSLKSDINNMSNKGLLGYPDIVKLEEKLQEPKIVNQKIIEYIRKNNTKKEFIWASLNNVHYGYPIIYNAPIFISRYTLGMPMFSKVFYENLLYKLEILNIDESLLFQDRSKVKNLIDSKVLLLSKDKIQILSKKYKVKFLITKGIFSFMKPILQENDYNLYDLSILKD